MQCMLNFSGENKKALLAFLRSFPLLEAKTAFELLRCRIGKSTVTFYKSGKLLVQGIDCEKAKEMILQAVGPKAGLVLGIDETGRGEGFGPFVVAGVLADSAKMLEFRDSKKVKNFGEKMRKVEENALAVAVFSISSEELGLLHEKGISLNTIECSAINAMAEFFSALDKSIEVLVDGSPLKGCKKGVSFIVKGDDLNPVIGAASVVAKTARDCSADRGKRLGWGKWGKQKKE